MANKETKKPGFLERMFPKIFGTKTPDTTAENKFKPKGFALGGEPPKDLDPM